MISLHTIPMKVRNDYCYLRIKPQADMPVASICGADRVTDAFFEEELVMQVKVEVALLDHTNIYNIRLSAMDEFRKKPPMLIKELIASVDIWESQDFIPYLLEGIMDGKYKVRQY